MDKKLLTMCRKWWKINFAFALQYKLHAIYLQNLRKKLDSSHHVKQLELVFTVFYPPDCAAGGAFPLSVFQGRQTDHKACGEGYSWLPEFKLSIFTISRDEIVVRVMFDAYHILVMNLKYRDQ